ncbi:Spy0128 family protein [Streptococcus suis]
MARLRKLFVILLVFLGGIFSAQIVSADTVDITVSNTKLTPEKIGYKQSTEFSFDFAVPESAKEGDTTILSLPNELNFQRIASFDVYSDDGQVVAKAVADTSTKKLTLTYTNYVDKNNDTTGKMTFNVVVDSDVVKSAQDVSATLMVNTTDPSAGIVIGSGTIHYLGPVGEPDTLNFWKYGITSAKNTITYFISINTARENVSDVVIADVIKSPGLEYVEGSFKISEGDFVKNDLNYWVLQNRSDVTANYNVELSNDKTSFKVNLGNISRGFSISYRVKANYNLVGGERVENYASYSSGTTQKGEDKEVTGYQDASGSANGYNYSLGIKKVNEEGVALAGAEFTVIRKATGQVVGTLTTGVDGTATIAALLRDEYILHEVTPPSGYVAGTDVVVNPADFDSTSKIASKTIVNKKKPSEPAKVVLKATKTLEGRTLADQEFEFKLIDKAKPEVIDTVKNDATGLVSFKELTFNAPGNYTYTVNEVNGGAEGIQYDSVEYDVTVTVTDAGNGQLVAIVDKDESVVKFTNKYTPTPVKATLEVTKVLSGRPLKNGEFNFVLKDENGAVVETVQNDKDGKVKFSELLFKKADTYNYTIVELNDGKVNVTYDDLEVKVKVTISDNGKGKLIATVEYPQDAEFNNKYVEPTTTTTTTTTTEEPTTTTSETTTTTEEPTTTTSETTTTTEEPTTTTSETTTTTEEPTTTTSETTTTTEEPTTTTSETTTTTEEPTTTTSETTTTTEEPTTTTSETTTTTEEPTTTTLETTTTTSEEPPVKPKRVLPSTGDTSTIWTTLLGLAILLASGLGFYFHKKKV